MRRRRQTVEHPFGTLKYWMGSTHFLTKTLPRVWTHTSTAIHDALIAAEVPVIEVHISNVHRREDFRHFSYVSRVAKGVLAGFGTNGYRMAIQHYAGCLEQSKT